MALGETLKSWRNGQWRDGLNYLFVSQDEVDRGRAADTQLEALVKADYERGVITAAQRDLTDSRIGDNSFAPGGIFSQDGTDIVGGFQEGLKEGANNIQKGVHDAVGGTINFGLGMIPWQAWVLLAIYLAWRFGAFKKR